ncbi:chromosome segregation protein SMC [Raoultibacter massiliensis]|uniref:chromosome segregation protein SMC n=1 Tax=Raoultibacter massiliensis TaxID=1852371 RepID=UPI000C85528A|nr:chromosome segregation protein SMC [Raoultibacter massiliensis]
MYLKSLVLKGFKSFADRSVLSLEPGITAIVGPNGSGKSNISDSVLWVLGERNAKNLRGQAMEDVIFAGSSARKSVGIAEVDLVLDNSDGTLPVDYTEVAVTRRMYRSGESEYLINGALARRMDVLDILHDSGLGTGTHSIISQGSLDSILQSKPEDRRAIIEEAAGVLKHKQRKLKSQRKLEQMDVHLARVRDVAAEVERQLKPLERKAKRAQAYQGLADELAELNLLLAVDDLRMLQEKWGKATELERDLDGQLVSMREAIDASEKEIEALQERIQERNVNTGELSRQYRRAQSALERFDATALLLHEKKRAAMSYESEIQISLAANKEKARQTQEDRAQALEQLEEVAAEKRKADAQVEALLAEQRDLTEKRSALERSVQEWSGKEKSLAREIETTRLAQAETNELLTNSRAHEKLIAGHSKELEIQLAHAKSDYDRAHGTAEANERKLAELKELEEKARQSVSDAFAAREEAREAFDGARDAASMLASEIRGLEEVERASEAAGPALSWLMEHREEFEAGIEPLSHVIIAPKGSEMLVEHLLGGDLAALFVSDTASANVIAEALCAVEETGEVVLLPRKSMRAPVAETCEGERLVDALEYPEECADAVEGLLGDVYLCESREAAIAAHEASAGGARFATRDGFAIWPNGKMVVGANQHDEEGALARHRRIEELRGELVQAEEAQAEAGAARDAADGALREAQGESLKLSQDLAQLKGQTDSSKEELKRAEAKLAALQREFEDLERQRAEAQEVLKTAQPTADELVAKLAELEKSLEEAKRNTARFQQEVSPLRKRANDLSNEFSEARLAAATSAERETYTRRVVEAREREIESIIAQDETAKDTLAKKALARTRVVPLLAVFEELSDSAKKWTQRLEDETLAAQDSSSGLHAAMSEARKKSREAHDAFDAVNERLSQARVDKGRLEVQVEAAIGTIVNDCKTPLETALATPPLENRAETEDKTFKLRRRIANMGTINPDAAVEYEQLKRRYDYMASQLDDLNSARRSLSKIVSVIDARMKDDFVKTYEQVNINFQEIFAMLFPGGSAELSLVDPEDPENTGVEVTAQPRGKRITKMMLMSGGEKSLTALALLFAVYRIRSTPFYILDEVEAALDDSNLRRLCAYLDSLRHTTQLIMITHQRRTMEMADVLYGISMQADGVTRVVSQKLDHALRYAED